MTVDPLAQFERLLAQRPLPLLALAAEVPRYADPALDPAVVVSTVDRWGEQLNARLAPDTAATMRWRQLNHFFFDELGFGPNADRYYDPANSHLHAVIERRRGIPITLALLYIEIGRRAGLKLHGIGFPGHFLVRLALGDGHMFLDMFAEGAPLSEDDLAQRLHAATRGAPDAPLELYLRPASDRDILARLLRNLKLVHLQAGDMDVALQVQHRLVATLPDNAAERRARAAMYEKLECPRAAADDLAAYMDLAPDAPDLRHARDDLQRLRACAARLN
jgi:regulator of sirC expression with transglutaminase-like and TPR domain